MNRIRSIRKSRGMTMKELGSLIGVSEAAVSQYETGKRNVDNETLYKIGEVFDVSASYLLGWSDSEHDGQLSAVEVPVSGSGNVGSVIVFKPGTMDEKALEAVKAFIEQMGGEVL